MLKTTAYCPIAVNAFKQANSEQNQISIAPNNCNYSGVTLTLNQRGQFEHHMKIGMITALYKQGLLSASVYMDAVRIQETKDKQFFAITHAERSA